ncbi:MAG TPA: TetR/AcrR family transcriptional regulator [Baekduia sp.]|nr:TetR/AcrR family transcriptional regulator [Baekduia sp.]
MPRPSREAEILDAALACFAERGYDATRVRHIAERAQVSEAALYRHHPSKKAVGLALFATHMRRYAALLQTVADDPDRSTQERVKGLVHAALQARRTDPTAHRFVLGHQQQFLSALPADFPYPIRIVDRLIQEGQADGTVKAGPVRVLSALVVGCLNQPAIVAQHAARGTIDLDSPGTADLIADGAWAAIAVEP